MLCVKKERAVVFCKEKLLISFALTDLFKWDEMDSFKHSSVNIPLSFLHSTLASKAVWTLSHNLLLCDYNYIEMSLENKLSVLSLSPLQPHCEA